MGRFWSALGRRLLQAAVCRFLSASRDAPVLAWDGVAGRQAWSMPFQEWVLPSRWVLRGSAVGVHEAGKSCSEPVEPCRYRRLPLQQQRRQQPGGRREPETKLMGSVSWSGLLLSSRLVPRHTADMAKGSQHGFRSSCRALLINNMHCAGCSCHLHRRARPDVDAG